MLTRDRVQGLQLIEEIGTKFCKDIVSAMASSRQLGIFQAGKEMFKQLIPSWRKSLGTLRDMIDEALKDEQPKKPRKSERKSLKTRMQESFARQRRQSSS